MSVMKCSYSILKMKFLSFQIQVFACDREFSVIVLVTIHATPDEEHTMEQNYKKFLEKGGS
jgi:hypothetical protein